jgi:hypothetical protein
MSDASRDPQKDWVNAHMGRTSKETAHRLLTTDQPRPPENAPVLTLRGVRGRCVAGGASNFWIVKSEAAEPLLDGDFPLTGMSPTAYFIQVPRFNYLPYAVRRAGLTAENHSIAGDTSELERSMREVYG